MLASFPACMLNQTFESLGITNDSDQIHPALDREDRAAGRKISVPMLALWGAAGIPGAGESPLDVWKRWCDEVEGAPIEAGHFIVEEAPDETLAAMLEFFEAG